MLSAVISARHGYPAMPLAGQLAHQRSVHSGPLVLRAAPLKSPAPTADRDRPSSLTRVLPIALVCSTHLPCRFAVRAPGTQRLEAFLGSLAQPLPALRHRHHSSGSGSGFTWSRHLPTSLAPESNNRLVYIPASPLHSSQVVRGY